MDSTPSRDAALDNPVWHALSGPLTRFARGDADESAPAKSASVLRFDPEVAFFFAVDRLGDAAWEAQADFVGIGGFCVLFRDEVPRPPDGWEEHYRGPCHQLVAGDLPARPNLETVTLGADDVDDMLELTRLAEPGPFFARTFELGRYIGLRRKGRLVAMAGERFRVPGFVEVSAVCTHPDVRGEGLGGALTLEVAHGIRERGDEAFLHVLTTNESAYQLYLKLGFRVRRNIDVVAAQWHDDGLPAGTPRGTSEEGGPVEGLPDPETTV